MKITIKVKALRNGNTVNQSELWIYNITGEAVCALEPHFDFSTGEMVGDFAPITPVLDFSGKALNVLKSYLSMYEVRPNDIITAEGYDFTLNDHYMHIRIGYHAEGRYAVEDEKPVIIFNTKAGIYALKTTDFSAKSNRISYLPVANTNNATEKKTVVKTNVPKRYNANKYKV